MVRSVLPLSYHSTWRMLWGEGGFSLSVESLIDKCIQGEIAGVILFIIRKMKALNCAVL
jgi:hypothetical protein